MADRKKLCPVIRLQVAGWQKSDKGAEIRIENPARNCIPGGIFLSLSLLFSDLRPLVSNLLYLTPPFEVSFSIKLHASAGSGGADL